MRCRGSGWQASGNIARDFHQLGARMSKVCQWEEKQFDRNQLVCRGTARSMTTFNLSDLNMSIPHLGEIHEKYIPLRPPR